MLLLVLLSCGDASSPMAPDPCPGRADDADCDGVPDGRDLCPASPTGFTDAAGCAEAQEAGCRVGELRLSPLGEGRWRLLWEGDCAAWVVQSSPDAAFLPGRSRMITRTSLGMAEVALPPGWVRVLGGQEGNARAAASAPQAVP